ncbi:MAG: hypothetical protein M1461_07845 [Nitrospirae bacterium]|nr:hypothetical protein [Nitrospirota bacterium]
MLCTFAQLDREKLEAIQSLEKKLGKTVIAFSCQDIGITPLKEDEIAQMRDLEQKLGLALVAVK